MATTGKPVAGGYYPPVGFHFKVEVLGIGNDNDSRFQSVSGLTLEFDVESIKEGGENRYEHKLPGRTKYPDLSLKRGLLTDSSVIEWCTDALQNREIKPAILRISLLNESHEPVMSWKLHNAWPRKWSVSDFNATDNSIAVETIDISYNYFEVET
ncbi:phage tail protein [bacterium]|nr:phage tail protein [bacterium]